MSMWTRSTTYRFLGYWLGFWVFLSFMACLFVNPPSSSFVRAFWNPVVWASMAPLCCVPAWFCARYHSQIKAFTEHKITVRIGMAFLTLNGAWSGWERGVRENAPIVKTAASVLFIFGALVGFSGVVDIVKLLCSRWSSSAKKHQEMQ